MNRFINRRIAFVTEHIFTIVFLVLLAYVVWKVPFWIHTAPFFHTIRHHNTLSYTLFVEIFKLFFIVLFGGIGIAEFNRSRQKRVDRKQYRREVSNSLISSYIELKKLRMDLYVYCQSDKLSYEVYKEAMQKLADIKSRIEVIIYEIDIGNKSFKRMEEELKVSLEKMENYLRGIVSDYKDLPVPRHTFTPICVANNSKLKDFIKRNSPPNDPSATSNFSEVYKKCFKHAIKLLKEDKLKNEDLVWYKFIRSYWADKRERRSKG